MGFREELQKRLEKKRSEISSLSGKLKEAEIYAQAIEDMLKLLPRDDGAPSEASADSALREGSNIARAKEALQKFGRPMQINELLSAMGKSPDKDTRAALAGSIGAYVRRGEIFTRPGPNTFGLIGMKPLSAQPQSDGPPDSFGLEDIPNPTQSDDDVPL
jgi:hypothetical protein